MTCDLLSDLYARQMNIIAETIFFLAGPPAVTTCFQVCWQWNRQMSHYNVWKRLVEICFSRNSRLRLLSKLNEWTEHIPRMGGMEAPPAVYKQIAYKLYATNFIWKQDRLHEVKLYTGSLFACIKLHRGLLFAGMIDGKIKAWNLSEPIRNEKAFRIMEGHEERVTDLDGDHDYLVSGSLDHSVRVWNVNTGAMTRVLRGPASPILDVKLTKDRLISLSKSGLFTIWSWSGPYHIEYLYQTSLDPNLGSVQVAMGNSFIVVARQDLLFINDLEEFPQIQVYGTKTGRRIRQVEEFLKRTTLDTRCAVHCLAVYKGLLCLGVAENVEVWCLEKTDIAGHLVTLYNGNTAHASQSGTSLSVYVRDLSVSDWLVVAMLSTFRILVWSLPAILSSGRNGDALGSGPTLVINNQDNMDLGAELVLGFGCFRCPWKLLSWQLRDCISPHSNSGSCQRLIVPDASPLGNMLGENNLSWIEPNLQDENRATLQRSPRYQDFRCQEPWRPYKSTQVKRQAGARTESRASARSDESSSLTSRCRVQPT